MYDHIIAEEGSARWWATAERFERAGELGDMVSDMVDDSEQFFELSLDLLCIADTSGRFRRVNQEWTRILGYTREELTGTSFGALVHPDDLQSTKDAVLKLSQRREIHTVVNRYRCKDGSWRRLEWRALRQGDLIYAAARDITARHLAEETLREGERLLNLLSGMFVNIELAQDELICGRVDAASERLERTLAIFEDARASTRNLLTFSEGGAPAKQEEESVRTVENALNAASASAAKRILVMDDESSIRDVISRMLTSLGYEVDSTSDGAAAVSRYRDASAAETPFDAVLLDLTVPRGMGGQETLKALSAVDPHVRAVASSGYADDPVMSNPAAYGFSASLRKPFRKKQIDELFSNLFSR